MRPLRWLVLGNPFYPLSAVLVLFGVFLLSGDERVFSTELKQLFFNFGSVGFYGLLIAVTAVFLFRRQIYYDTLMLVVLVTMPLLVPFILISQAAFLGNGIMIALCVLAVGIGIAQCWILRRGVFELPLNSGLSVFVVGVICLNLVMPITIKLFQDEAEAITWIMGWQRFGPWLWKLLIPIVVTTCFFIPQMGRRKFGDCRVGWLPTVLMLLLVAGTALHFCSLGYVYAFAWKTDYAIPAAWVATWLVYMRRAEWGPEGGRRLAEHVVFAPALFGVLPFAIPINDTLLFVSAANLLIYSVIALRRNYDWALRFPVLLSLAGVLNCVPGDWLAHWLPNTNHSALVMLAGSILVFAFSVFKRTPGWGIACAFSVLFPLSHLWLTRTDDWVLVGQFALLTWWLHSLRWDLDERQARGIQTTGFVVWCLQSVLWFLQSGGDGRLSLTAIAGVFMLTAALMIWKMGGTRYVVFLSVATLIVGLNGVGESVKFLRTIPAGLLALVAGMVLFGIGTLSAHWRKRLTFRGR